MKRTVQRRVDIVDIKPFSVESAACKIALGWLLDTWI